MNSAVKEFFEAKSMQIGEAMQNEYRKIEKNSYTIEYNEATGEIAGLYDRLNPGANWKAEAYDKKLGTIFIHGTQSREDEIPFAKIENTEKGFKGISATGASRIQYEFEEDRIHIAVKTEKDCGPRTGVQMNLNFLDMPTVMDWKSQCMPKVIYTDDKYRYAYFIFAAADGRHLGMTINEEFAAWRIQYSYDGHKMTGFQILLQADDVICADGERLPAVDHTSFSFIFAESLEVCMEKIAGQLGIEIAVPEVSGGPAGSRIPMKMLNRGSSSSSPVLIMPDGNTAEMEKTDSLVLEQNGIYIIKTAGENGREHSSRVLCQEGWKELYNKVNHFYKEYFQDDCGAFYRVISKDRRKPDGVTYEGVKFGDPTAHYSCRTGEFGGFAAWAMMKNCILFGKDSSLMESAERYILNWALNKSHEDKPFYGTVYKKESEYMGRKFSPYHLYQEMNYMQHEIFLLEELADYVRLTGDEEVLEDAVALAKHILKDHFEDGMIVNENTPGHKIDYSTVHPAVCGFLELGKLLRERDDANAQQMYTAAEQIADHVCRRAFQFPTEGEPCTEDGSMSCSVITLLRTYLEAVPKAEYLEMGEKILRAHRVLEMDGTDCRMKNSSIRFWETQYESRDWGPSLNAGHGWSIWTAEAKALYARIRHDLGMLKDSYEGFLTNICKVEACGGMSCCYTPDMLPGTPHAYYVNGVEVPDSINEMRPTSVHLAQKYVPKTYSVSGNFFLVRAADTFAEMSGFDCETETAVNGIYKDGVFESAAPGFNYLLIKGIPDIFLLKVKKGQTITIAFDTDKETAVFEHAKVKAASEKEVILIAIEDIIIIKRE